nr:MAG TPA: zinc finger domain-containing protein [Caudoviricetes sp.]
MTETPKCPYCGAGMELKYVCGEYFCLCEACEATSPMGTSKEAALSAALHRTEPDETCKQLCESFGASANATVRELFDAIEQLNSSAEPEMRPLTLDEVKNRCKSPLSAETLFLEFKSGWKSYRFWPRKPTPEQMAAEKWEE